MENHSWLQTSNRKKPQPLLTQLSTFPLEETCSWHGEVVNDLPGSQVRPGQARAAYLPSNLCLRKSKRAFCIMSVTWGEGTVLMQALLERAVSPYMVPDSSSSHCPWGLHMAGLPGGTLGLGISSYLITLQRGSHQHHRPHGGYHIIWGNMFCLQNEQYYGPGTSLMPVWWG